LKFESLSFKGKMKIKVTPIFSFPLYFMGGRTEKEDSKKKKKGLSKSIFMCSGKELRFLLIPIEHLVTRI
jgi:hypothetical protein